MRSTIEAGLKWIETNWQPNENDAFLLVPADHPLLDRSLIQQLTQAAGSNIVIPTFRGRRGHPTLISWKHVEGIRELPKNRGLNAYLREHAEEVFEVAVATESILLDLDTPQDYERLLEIFATV